MINVTEQVIEDIRERANVGLKKYGRPLHTFNGRSALKDLYEELLDAAQYIKQHMMELDATELKDSKLEKSSVHTINEIKNEI